MLLSETRQSGGLTLCPTDVVTTAGEFALLQAAGRPDSSLRWYRRRFPDRPGYTSVIYTGIKMDYKQVDERYYVAASREDEANLIIRDVGTADAGQFTVEERFSQQSARAHVVVIGKLSNFRFNEIKRLP